MGKNDLIGGSLWEQYSNKVNDRIVNPLYFGELTQEDAEKLGGRLVVADYGAEVCGDAIRLSIIVDEQTHKILDARFKTFGCGTAIASSDVMAEMCIGKTVDEALQITNIDVEKALRDEEDKTAIPPQKMHCSVMAYDVIKKAVSMYKGLELSELEQEDVVCECARVTLGTIKEVIRLNNLTTVEEITQYTKAGAFCKSCIKPGGHEQRKYYLKDILNETLSEMDKEEVRGKKFEEKEFDEFSLFQKHSAIEEILDKYVRPNLKQDGGGVEVIDIKQNRDELEVLVKYLGTCSTCPSAGIGTLGFIQEQLRKHLYNGIKIIYK